MEVLLQDIAKRGLDSHGLNLAALDATSTAALFAHARTSASRLDGRLKASEDVLKIQPADRWQPFNPAFKTALKELVMQRLSE